tara:strand:- start:227 stop:430 length:204 start_codon:yes stop_codon:yes gene_type:complete
MSRGIIKNYTKWDELMAEKMLEHRIAKDYSNSNIALDFEREDLFWSILFYQIEADKHKSEMAKVKRR